MSIGYLKVLSEEHLKADWLSERVIICQTIGTYDVFVDNMTEMLLTTQQPIPT